MANKTGNESQITVTWHVDDLKTSHINGWEIIKVIKKLSKIYGDIKVKRGMQYEYLEMDVNYGKRDKFDDQ